MLMVIILIESNIIITVHVHMSRCFLSPIYTGSFLKNYQMIWEKKEIKYRHP